MASAAFERHHVPADLADLARKVAATSAAGLAEELYVMGEKCGIMQRTRLNARNIVISNCNRGGYGVNASIPRRICLTYPKLIGMIICSMAWFRI